MRIFIYILFIFMVFAAFTAPYVERRWTNRTIVLMLLFLIMYLPVEEQTFKGGRISIPFIILVGSIYYIILHLVEKYRNKTR